MFLEYYGFREQPFGVTPDPRFIYFGSAHREALASLQYAIETKRGFSAMIAEPGMGKTSLLFHLLESLQGSARTAFLFQTNGDAKEILRGLLSDLGIRARGKGIAAMHDELNKLLLDETQAGRKMVVVIDEAQNLDDAALETVRLLSNFETPTEKLMHIVLAGQPKLADKLAAADLVQLRQRVSTVIRLEPFHRDETGAYIRHRLHAAGYEGPAIFSEEAVNAIARLSHGIPRNINNICFQALSLGFATETKVIGQQIMQEVARDLECAAKPARVEERSHSESSARWPPASARLAPPNPQSSSTRAPSMNSAAPAYSPPLLIFWNREEPTYSPTAPKHMARWILACTVILVIAIAIFSDPKLELSQTVPGHISSQIVNAVLSSGDSNSDFLPALPKPLKAPLAPGVETTATMEASASSAAENQSDETSGQIESATAGADSQANDEDSTAEELPSDPPGNKAPSRAERTERRSSSEVPSSGVEETQYRGPSRVEIQHRENLFQLSLEVFGKSNWSIVEKICGLNPQIRGPYDMLSAGQWVRLPTEFPPDPESELHDVASVRRR